MFSIDLHNVMQVVVSARADDEVGDLRRVAHLFCEPLVVVNVARQNHIGVTPGLFCGSFNDLLHKGATGMVIIRRIDWMMQRHEKRNGG